MTRLLSIVAVSASLLSGCSSSSLPPQYDTTGTVTLDGAPAHLVSVRFASTDDAAKSGTAVTKEDGSFSTALQPGEYKVAFSQTVDRSGKPIPGSGGKKSEAIAGERENIPDEYRDPTNSKFVLKVEKGEKQTVKYDLVKKKR